MRRHRFRDRDPSFYSRTKAIEHLNKHIEAGDIVPEYALERLQKEIEEIGDFYYEEDPPKNQGLLCIVEKEEIKGDTHEG